MKALQQLQVVFYSFLIFFWPSNLFIKFAEHSAYVHGLLVDYLLPKLYLSDLLIIVLLFSWILEKWFTKKKQTSQPTFFIQPIIFLSLLFLLAMAQVISPKPIASFWFVSKIAEMGFLLWWLVHHHWLLQRKLVIFSLAGMLIFQSVIGLGQFIRQTSVFPSYSWFGESRLEYRAGLARGNFGDTERVLPYGTTAHPNILGGVLAVGCLCLWTTLKKHTWAIEFSSLFFILASALSLITLALTQSWSAWFCLAAGTTVLKTTQLFKKKPKLVLQLVSIGMLLFLLTPVVIYFLAQHSQLPSITRRNTLNQAAIQLFVQHPLTGVGLNAFTAKLEDVSPHTEVVRFVQPAHHVGLLWLAETGGVGIVIVGVILLVLQKTVFVSKKTSCPLTLLFILSAFLPLMSLDHYLLTQQTGQLISVIGGVWLFRWGMDRG